MQMIITFTNILENIRLGTVPENVIIFREQFLCWSWVGDRIDNRQSTILPILPRFTVCQSRGKEGVEGGVVVVGEKGIYDQWLTILSILPKFTFCQSEGGKGIHDWHLEDQQSTFHMKRWSPIVDGGDLRELCCPTISVRSTGLQLVQIISSHLLCILIASASESV